MAKLRFEPTSVASLVAQTVKNLPAIQETQVWFLGQEDSLEKRMATHSRILAWRIPWTEEPRKLYSPWDHKELDTTEWLTLSLHFFRCSFYSLLSEAYSIKKTRTRKRVTSTWFINFSEVILSTAIPSLLWTHKSCASSDNGSFIVFRTFSSVQFSRSVMSNSLEPHELQHARLPWSSPTPGTYSNSWPWVRDAIQPCYPLLLLPSIFSNEVSSLHQMTKVLEF